MNPTSADRDAAEWFSRRQTSAFGPRDECVFQDWLLADAAHREAWARTERMWDRLGAAVRTSAPISPAGRLYPRSSARVSVAAVALAACILVAIAGWHLFAGTLFPRTYQTSVGETRSFTLVDGSVVTLDTDSRMRVRYGESRREVELTAGVAFFDVSPDKSRPFVVSAALGRVTVLGTRFEVRSAPDRLRVVLVEGSVRLDAPDGPDGEEQAAGGMSLRSGQMATRTADQSHWATSAADIEAALAWQRGLLVMRDRPLEQALSEVNRYSTTQLRIGEPALRRLRVSGVFRAGDVESFEQALEQTLRVQVDARGSEHVFMSAARTAE